MTNSSGLLFVSSLLLLLLLSSGTSGNVVGQKDLANLEAKGLYDPAAGDRVVVLNEGNFRESVYGSERAWLVEFYNSWCGFCQRFAPIWKLLANNTAGWSDIVAVAALDCANDNNTQLCREHEIMHYPMLKFFHLRSDKGSMGLVMEKEMQEEGIRKKLIKQLLVEQQEQRGDASWPNITPYRGDELQTLWQGAPEEIQYQFLIFEKPDEYTGAQVILDLHKQRNIRIRRATSENEPLSVASKVDRFPGIVAIGRDDLHETLHVNADTREVFEKTIAEYLKSKRLSLQTETHKYDSPNSGSGSQPTHSSLPTAELEDKLYQLDLEGALRHSLTKEIPLSLSIQGEKLQALRMYLRVLAAYFPARNSETRKYLHALEEMAASKDEVSGREFKERAKLEEKNLPSAYASNKTVWIGCKGSSGAFRGYPCGLWTTFHVLTVAASEEADKDLSVLEAMHGYIKHFFGCSECSEHFQEMAERRKLFEVRDRDEGVLWLWRAHNEVNQRLAGDETEDPEHKKIQYPAESSCPRCRLEGGDWSETEVLRYLKSKYARSSVDYTGISVEVMKPGGGGGIMDNGVSSSGVSFRRMGWNFTVFDFSICVLLYAISAAILIMHPLVF